MAGKITVTAVTVLWALNLASFVVAFVLSVGFNVKISRKTSFKEGFKKPLQFIK